MPRVTTVFTLDQILERVDEGAEQRARARRWAAEVVVQLQDGEVNHEWGYARTERRHLEVMLGGGGPSTYLHIVFDGADVDHMYVESCAFGRGLWLVPSGWWLDIVEALGEPVE